MIQILNQALIKAKYLVECVNTFRQHPTDNGRLSPINIISFYDDVKPSQCEVRTVKAFIGGCHFLMAKTFFRAL